MPKRRPGSTEHQGAAPSRGRSESRPGFLRRWLRRPPEEPEPASPPGPEIHRSPGLEALATELRRRGRSRGLAVDLGPAIGDNIAFFSRLCSRVYVADFAAALATHGQTAPVTGLLSDLGDDPVGAVLAWDLLNYLPPERLAELGGILADGCRPGALAFALIGYLKEIPDCPLRFRVHDTTTLAYENRSPHSRLSPRYSPHDLSRLLPAFRVETSYLLRNGYQELVLERR